MKGYNAVGYTIILAYALACMYSAPPSIGPWAGLLIGAAYFVICWFIGGLYLSSVIHMGIAHRALDYKEWFVNGLTLVNNTFGVYVDLASFVSDHLHQVGIEAPVKLIESAQWFPTLARREYQIGANLTAGGVDEPDILFYDFGALLDV